MTKRLNKLTTPERGENKQQNIQQNIGPIILVTLTSGKTMPEYWKDKPERFKTNEWLIENQDHMFVKRLGNAISQIQMDINIKSPSDAPMAATKACMFGDEAAKATKFQYTEAEKQVTTFKGDDAKQVQTIMELFKETFKEYLPFLEG